jgi:hypothetical protein
MADQTVITEEKKEEKSIGQEVREKTFSQLLKEQATAKPTEDTPTETLASESVPDTIAEDKSATEIEAKKQEEEKQQAQEAAKKRDEELAAKAAEEVVKKQQQEKQAELDKAKAEENEKARLEALKPKFAGVDEKGNPVPKDYAELAEESARIATEKAKEEIRAEIAAKEAKTAEETEAKQQQEAAQKKAVQDREAAFAKELQDEEADLYAKNLMPKIKDPNNPKDPGIIARDALYKKAVEVNSERIAKGEPAIRSIKLIYYEHYKPAQKPAGYDAPVMGNESTISNELPDDKYIPARDRNKSYGQILKEEAAKAAAKFKIRGN